MRKYWLSLATALLLTGCASSSQQQYNDLVENGHSPIAHSFEQAVGLSKPSPLPVNRGLFPERWEISATDPRIVLQGQQSNYRLFEFRLRKDQRYVINVVSICNNMCFGFAKRILKPVALVLDTQGKVIADNLEGSNPLAIEWAGVAPADGSYLLLITADNQSPGKRVSVLHAQLPNNGGVLPIGVESAPFGKVIAYVEYPDES